jgi:PAS domain-containing protein
VCDHGLDDGCRIPGHLAMIEPFKDIEDARSLAQAIVDTVREPLLVLDSDLRVLAVSRSYYLTFRVDRQDVLGRPLYALGDGQWQIPALRKRLEKIIPERAAMAIVVQTSDEVDRPEPLCLIRFRPSWYSL